MKGFHIDLVSVVYFNNDLHVESYRHLLDLAWLKFWILGIQISRKVT